MVKPVVLLSWLAMNHARTIAFATSLGANHRGFFLRIHYAYHEDQRLTPVRVD